MRFSLHAATSAAFLGLALIPVLARAQTETPQMPAVTVTAGRGTDIEKLDVSTTVITREQIQVMPQTSLDQIVNRIPGVWSPTIPTGQLHPTGQPFNIRGFGSSTTINTLVMVDGVPINDPYFRTVDWSQVSKASIERIEVIRGGGATSLWGNMAMGGVVNIITREPSRTGVALDANYGSYNTFNGEGYGSMIFNDKLKAGLSYAHSQSSGYNLTPAQYQNANLVPTASWVDNVTFSAYLTPGESTKLFVKGYYHQASESGLTWQMANNQWSTYRLLAGGSHKLDETSSINFSAWAAGGTFGTTNASSGSYSLNNINALNQFVSQRETAPNNNQGGSIFYQLEAGPLKDIKIGVDARRIQITDNLNLYASATANPTTFVARGEHRLEGVFGQGTYAFKAIPLDVTVGLRGDFYQAMNASFFNQNAGAINPIADSAYSSFDPRIGLKFYATDQLTLRGAAYRNFSAPGMNQMYRSFAAGTSFTTTNPNLQPMTNFGQEVGFDFNWKKVSLSATWFNNNLDNFIDFVSICTANAACAAPFATAAGLTGITSVNQYINVGNARFTGFEVIASWQPLPELRLSGGFTQTTAYLTSTTMPNLLRTGVQLGQVPNWMLTAAAEWRPIADLSINISLKSFPAYWNNTGHTQLNDAATLIDLAMTYSFNKSIDIYGAIQNLTNAQYLAAGYSTTSFEGPFVNPTAIPALGMPLTAAVGMRARF
ncbi:MAG: TonB-dependent receptor [Reyranella sp.]|uniref:TonB-dependent receptor n=1 Tax=Reyranella sp. TaxID=1929291 RepID=UPI001ACA1BEC|nr:TonB-dependent receptor [Reyranella sp.]MBN9091519.1 TonB-dependent receptor [Reyranella sp.]